MNVAVVKEEAHEGVCWKNSSHIIGKYLPLASVFYFAVILLQIVLVSPGARLVKNHESLSITIEYQFKKKQSPKLEMLRSLCNQTVNLETDTRTLFITVY